MEMTAQAIADWLGGELVGDPAAIVTGPARIEQARKGNICFLANPKYEHYIYDTQASVLLVNRSFVPKQPVPATLILVDDAYAAVAQLLEFFAQVRKKRKRGNRLWARLSPKCSIACSARIGKGTHISPQVYVGPRVRIGRNCEIHPGVRIMHDCVIGDNCILHANAVIGEDGFGFAPLPDGSYRKIPQLGNVILEDNVDIGAGTAVDRSTMGSTIIRKGVKIGNLCEIAHNVEVGENTVMAGLTGVAGSAKIGRRCKFGGQAGINGHITVPDDTSLAGQSGLITSLKEPGQVLMGFPALEHGTFLRAYAKFRRSGQSD
jgi:UDP-3-O-[3-hydroxymyristoyl] glucosamine N-acyltransferase